MCPTDVKIKGVKRFLSELFFLLFETKFSEIFMVLGQVLIADFGTCWALTYFILECVKKKAKNGVICSRCPGDDRVVVLSFNSSYFESYYLKTDWTNGRTRTIPGVIYWCDAQVEPRQVHLFKKKTAPKTKKGGFKKKADTSKVLFSAHVRSPPPKSTRILLLQYSYLVVIIGAF